MSVLAKVVNLILLLIALNAARIITSRLGERERDGLMSWGSFLAIQILVVLVAFFTNIWLLSRFFDLGLVVLFFVGAYAGLLIAGLMWALLGSPRVAWRPRYAWAWQEFLKTPSLLSVLAGLGGIIILIGGFAYTALAINIIFRLTIPSDAATQLAFQITLALAILTILIVELPLEIGLLLSKNLDEDTRTGMLVVDVGFLSLRGLYLALLFWSFGTAGGGLQFAVGGVALSFSPLLLIVLSLFLLAYFVPYLAGSQRAKKTREDFLKRQQSWLSEILDILDFPTPAQYAPRLEQFQEKVKGEIDEFAQDDQMVQKGLRFDRGESLDETDSDWESLAQAYQKSRQLDPRFRYLDFLSELSEKAGESLDQLSSAGDGPRLEEIARGYARAYRARKDEFSKAMELESKSRSPLWVGLTFILSLLVAQFVSEIANVAWNSLSGATGP